MTKYSEEFKIKLVIDCLDGNIGYKLLAKKYNLSSQTPIQNWVRDYKKLGIEDLKRRKYILFNLNSIRYNLCER